MKYQVTVNTIDTTTKEDIYTNILEYSNIEAAENTFMQFANGCNYGYPESEIHRSRFCCNDAKVITPRYTSVIALKIA